MNDLRESLRLRIQEYLELGGLFNPEQMDHRKVSQLLQDVREYFEANGPRPMEIPESVSCRASELLVLQRWHRLSGWSDEYGNYGNTLEEQATRIREFLAGYAMKYPAIRRVVVRTKHERTADAPWDVWVGLVPAGAPLVGPQWTPPTMHANNRRTATEVRCEQLRMEEAARQERRIKEARENYRRMRANPGWENDAR